MGTYLTRYWTPDGYGMNKVERMGGAYHPYMPDRLVGFESAFSPSCVDAIARATEALVRLDGSRALMDTEPVARILLMAEAVSSSRIEGLEMSASKLLEYEELDRLGANHPLDGTEVRMLGNLRALTNILGQVRQGAPVTLDLICEFNRMLLAGTRLEEVVGRLWKERNWIGGDRVNTVGAAYVPPIPDEVPMTSWSLSIAIFGRQRWWWQWLIRGW